MFSPQRRLKKSGGVYQERKPAVVFAPHVETTAGIILPDEYLKAVGEAVRSVNGLFVLDCIASGAVWVDMKACNVDVLITTPQKGWSRSPCCALIALGDRARERIKSTQSSSFSMDLKKWLQIMEAYEKGGHVYLWIFDIANHHSWSLIALSRYRVVAFRHQ